MPNYDINIFDEASYESDGKVTGSWKFSFYSIQEPDAGYGSGVIQPNLDLSLTKEEADRLTLGLDEDEGGDYIGDDDFWIDVEGFLDTYTDIPTRIQEWLEGLLESS